MAWILAGAVAGLAVVALAAVGLARWDRGRQVRFWSGQAGSSWPISVWLAWGGLAVVSVTCIARPARDLPLVGFLAVMLAWGGLLLMALRWVVSTHNRGVTAADK